MNGILKNKGAVAFVLLLAAALVVAAFLWGNDIWRLMTDEEVITAFIERAGFWGPLALIALNILQIVVAPIPGYVVQLAAGYLYGTLWGGIYAAIGMLVGSMLAMALARIFGRPVARVLIGEARLQHWEHVTHSNSVWVWFLLLAGPVGDIPFALAGLSSVSFLTIFLITLVIRVPSAFLSTAIGGGAVPFWWMLVLLAFVSVLMYVGMRYREPITAWFEGLLRVHVQKEPPLLPVKIDQPADESVPPAA